MNAIVRSFKDGVARILFPTESDQWLSVLRVGLGLQVALYAVLARRDWLELFGSHGYGLLNRKLTEDVLSVQSPFAPKLGWLISVANHLRIDETITLWFVWLCLFVVGGCLILGIFSRSAAVIAWLLHLCTVKSEEFLTYGVDNFTTIGLFYLMLSPLPDQLSLDWRWRNLRSHDRDFLGFFRRALQVHLCINYFFGGIMKSLGVEWWNGTSIWRVLISPPFNVLSPQLLVHWKYLFQFAGIFVCAIETGYPLFIWFKKTRLLWLACICTIHFMIAVTMGLYLFSLVMITLNLAAFAPFRVPGWAYETDVGVNDDSDG